MCHQDDAAYSGLTPFAVIDVQKATSPPVSAAGLWLDVIKYGVPAWGMLPTKESTNKLTFEVNQLTDSEK